MLSDIAVRAAKAAAKPYRLADEKGLYLEVAPTGGKWWRLKYRFAGKEKRLSLGVYPTVTLKDAREKRDAARKLLASHIDPSVERRIQKASRIERAANSFETVAREWFAKRSPNMADSHRSRVLRALERDVFPWLATRPVAEVTAPELLLILRRIEGRGAAETAQRLRQICGQVFRYAIATGRAECDPAADLKGAIIVPRGGRFPAITEPKALGALLHTLWGYQGTFVVRSALRLAPYTFVRPGELRKAEWRELDLDGALWKIPGPRMKGRVEHLVPLSRQAVEVLRELQPLTGSGRLVFPSVRSAERPMSDNTVLAALRRLGVDKSEMVGHGFRAAASTLLNEQGWNRDAIERQLAHNERDPVRAAYHRADYLAERRRMMQAWADYLDGLREQT
jgi:integrase